MRVSFRPSAETRREVKEIIDQRIGDNQIIGIKIACEIRCARMD
jgi:hypothetical protein